MDDEVLTVGEIARRLRVTPEVVRGWLRSGELAGVNFGGRTGYRVAEADLREFWERKRSGEAAA